MVEQKEFCQYNTGDMTDYTFPDPRLALQLRRPWWNFKRYVWHISILGLRRFSSRMIASTRLWKSAFKGRRKAAHTNSRGEALNLQREEWVEVRSAKEIFGTLDDKGKLKGLRFTPEMMKFCGKRFKIYKRLDKIILEETGELRKIKTPTVLLEGVFCDGSAHAMCDRSCFCFWREQWLRRDLRTSAKEKQGLGL